MSNKNLSYEQLQEADTASDPLPKYMLVDEVENPCRRHTPLALEHEPPASAVALRLDLILGSRHVVCAVCGATAIYGYRRLRWGDIFNASTKRNAIKFNQRVAAARAQTGGEL